MEAQTLKNYRVALGCTQREMAERMKVSLSIYSKWESQHAKIPAWVEDRVRDLATALSLENLTAEEVRVLNQRAREAGKSTELYIIDLIKAAIGGPTP